MQEWYYVKGGEQQGPVRLEQLRQLASRGDLSPQDLVWNATMKDWTPAGEVDGIFSSAPMAVPTATTDSPLDTVVGIPHDTPTLEDIEPGSDPLDIGACINHTVALTKRHFSTLALLGLVYFGITMAISLVFSVIQAGGGLMAVQIQGEAGTQAASGGMLAVSLFGQIIVNVVTLYLSMGIMRACLNLASGGEANVPMIFGEADKLLRAIGASILCAIVIICGLILLIVPGIYLALRLSATTMAIVDRNLSVMEAISYSMHITRGNLWRLLGLWTIAILIALVAIVVTCGIGAIFATPILTLGWVISYRWLRHGHRSLESAAS